jgi:Ca2+-binding RTX toxin-like protein
VIIAKGGDDLTNGGGDGDTIKAGLGDDQDFEVNYTGDDRYFGGAGNDLASGAGGNDLFKGGSGDDQLFGDEGDDQLVGGPGHDGLVGGDGADKMFGSTGADRMGSGGGDEDRDLMNCGPGTDRARVTDEDRVRHCEILRGHVGPIDR